jgi:hypothetical protein
LSDRYFIPFRLSDTPPNGWTRKFRKYWTTKQKASVLFNDNELRLISRLNDVENILPSLKNAVALANSDYLDFVKETEEKKRQAEKKAKARKERELVLRQNISSTLEKLNSPPVNQ